MTTSVLIDNVEYIVSDEQGAERLRRDISENNNGMGDKHQRKVMEMGRQDLTALESEAEMREKAEAKKSGAFRALIAGLSNDEAAQINWLAEKRFPELADEVNLSDYYFLDKDNEIAYIDPYTGKPMKEFKDGLFGTVMDSFGLVGPTMQFVPELVGGGLGLTAGAVSAALPGAMAGGAGGTFVGGSVGAAGRAGLSALFDGPPVNVSKLRDDLMINSAFGSIPLGAGFFRGGRPMFSKISKEFAGEDGASLLRTILEEGGENVDKAIEDAAKLGITITRGDVLGMKSRAGQIQFYLQMQPSSAKLIEFYDDRALRMDEALREFFDELQAGNLMQGATGAKLADMNVRNTVSISSDLQKTLDAALKKLAKKRKQRANRVYEESFKLDDMARSGEMGFAPLIDISDIGAAIQKQIDDPDTGKSVRDALIKVQGVIRDPTGTSLTGYKADTRALHNAIVQDLGPMTESLLGSNNKTLAGIVTGYKTSIKDAIKANNPIYERASNIYNPEKGHLQLLERKIFQNLVKGIQTGGETAAPLIQKMFSGNANPDELRTLRRLIQTEDPGVWQNLKADWLRTNLDDAVKDTVSITGVPNRFLARIGVRSPKRAFVGRGGQKKKAKLIESWEAIFGPEEFENLQKYLEMAQAVSWIATKTTSGTQPLQALERLVTQEGAKTSQAVANALTATHGVPIRMAFKGFDDITQRAIAFQKEAYEDSLIEALINPAAAQELKKGLDKINPFIYYTVQSVARGTPMVLPEKGEPTTFTPEGQIESMGDENLDLRRRMRELEEQNQQPSQVDLLGMDFSPSFDPLPNLPATPQLPTTPLSPGLLPSEEDREIAMRRQQGIAGLMA